MSVDQPFNIYREELSSQYQGLALWDPKPVENLHKQPGHVTIGDVGYLDNGAFIRMFNVTLPWDHPSNRLLGKPEKYGRIKPTYFGDIRDNVIREGEYYTPHVSKVDNISANTHEDSIGQMYHCGAQHRGAFLFLPHKGHRKDVLPMKVFREYIRDNVDNWFRWCKKMKLPVEQMEDLILVTGCTLVTSWATAAFERHISIDSEATTISLEARKSDDGGAEFFWRNIRGPVEYHNSCFDQDVQKPLPRNQCVFLRGFRAKHAFFRTVPMRAAAEPLPDDPDDDQEDETQVTRIPDGSKYRDPIVGILDYIIEKCNEDVSAAQDIVAIAHDDDLRFIKGVETLTADLIEEFLREKRMPLFVENGAAIIGLNPAYNEFRSWNQAGYSASSRSSLRCLDKLLQRRQGDHGNLSRHFSWVLRKEDPDLQHTPIAIAKFHGQIIGWGCGDSDYDAQEEAASQALQYLNSLPADHPMLL